MGRRSRGKKAKKRTETVQTTITSRSFIDESPNDNVTIPYGVIRTVRSWLEFIGMSRFLRSLKRETRNAPRLDLIVVALISYCLYTSNSMDACSRWLEDPLVRKVIGFRSADVVHQITIDRAVRKLGENREAILERLWKGVRERFEIEDYDVAVDGSAVVLYGPKSRLGKLGHPRDGGPGDLQVEFTVAVLMQLGIPVYVRPFDGNVSDEEQYREAIPEITALIQNKGVHALDDYKARGTELAALAMLAKVGATIIADNGASSKENIDRAKRLGNEMITRVRLNKSDDRVIQEHSDLFVEIEGLGVRCYKHTFDSSGRTNYLFWSKDLYDATERRAEASICRGL